MHFENDNNLLLLYLLILEQLSVNIKLWDHYTSSVSKRQQLISALKFKSFDQLFVKLHIFAVV